MRISDWSSDVCSSDLIEAAETRGHKVQVIDVLRCYMNIQPGQPEIWYRGKLLERFDAVIPRIGASVTFYGTAVVRQFEMQGVYTLNESVAITRPRAHLPPQDRKSVVEGKSGSVRVD